MLTRSTPQFLSLFCALALTAVGCDAASASGSSDDAAVKSTVAAKASGAADASAKEPAAGSTDKKADSSDDTAAATKTTAPKGDSAPADVGLGVDAASDRDVKPNSDKLHAALDKYAKCAMQCSLDPDERATDVDSCLLSCRNVAESAGVAPDTEAHTLVTNLDACIDTCNDKENIKPTNRSTCRLNCENVYKAKQAELERGA
jgi:hypothetical protein